MEKQKEQTRRAAGSNDVHKTRTSRKQPRQCNDLPQAQLHSPEQLDHETETKVEGVKYVSSNTSSRRLFGKHGQQIRTITKELDPEGHDGNEAHSNTSCGRCSRAYDQHKSTPHSSTQVQSKSAHTEEQAESSDEWDIIPRSTLPPHSTTHELVPSPSYDFPGTWDAALHETASTLGQVGIASKSYATALSQSGIGRAGWSIGSALLSSSNKRALSFAGWVVDQVEASADEFPGPIRDWLKSKANLDEARAKAKEPEERRRVRLVDRSRASCGRGQLRESEPLTFGDERGAFVLETHEIDQFGEFVGAKPVEVKRHVVQNELGWTMTPTTYSSPRVGVETTIDMGEEGQEVAEGVAGEYEEGEEGAEGSDDLIRLFG